MHRRIGKARTAAAMQHRQARRPGQRSDIARVCLSAACMACLSVPASLTQTQPLYAQAVTRTIPVTIGPCPTGRFPVGPNEDVVIVVENLSGQPVSLDIIGLGGEPGLFGIALAPGQQVGVPFTNGPVPDSFFVDCSTTGPAVPTGSTEGTDVTSNISDTTTDAVLNIWDNYGILQATAAVPPLSPVMKKRLETLIKLKRRKKNAEVKWRTKAKEIRALKVKLAPLRQRIFDLEAEQPDLERDLRFQDEHIERQEKWIRENQADIKAREGEENSLLDTLLSPVKRTVNESLNDDNRKLIQKARAKIEQAKKDKVEINRQLQELRQLKADPRLGDLNHLEKERAALKKKFEEACRVLDFVKDLGPRKDATDEEKKELDEHLEILDEEDAILDAIEKEEEVGRLAFSPLISTRSGPTGTGAPDITVWSSVTYSETSGGRLPNGRNGQVANLNFGASYKISKTVSAGFALRYQRKDTSTTATGTSIGTDLFGLAGFATVKQPSGLTFNFIAAVEHGENDVTSAGNSGTFDFDSFILGADVSQSFDLGSNWAITPKLGVNWGTTTRHAYTNSARTFFAAETFEVGVISYGASVARPFYPVGRDSGLSSVTATFGLGGTYFFEQPPGGVPSATSNVPEAFTDVTLSGGLDFLFTNGLSTSIDGSVQFGASNGGDPWSVNWAMSMPVAAPDSNGTLGLTAGYTDLPAGRNSWSVGGQLSLPLSALFGGPDNGGRLNATTSGTGDEALRATLEVELPL